MCRFIVGRKDVDIEIVCAAPKSRSVLYFPVEPWTTHIFENFKSS